MDLRGLAIGVLTLALACGAPGVRLSAVAPKDARGCYLGSSDPTLSPPDAWEAAAEAAMAEAARALLGVHVRSGERVASCEGCDASVSLVQTKGLVRGLTVVGWWLDPGGPGRTRGTVWAVACVRGREAQARALLPGAFEAPGVPDWLRRPRSGCAVGLSGPTLEPKDAVAAAREDARRRLAMAVEAEVDAAVVELAGPGQGPRGTWDFRGVRPTAQALERVVGVGDEGPAWVDWQGQGPLGTKGLAYALACLF